jgi:hypothetical protein
MTPTPKDTQAELDGQAARAMFRAFVQEQVRQRPFQSGGYGL